VAAKVFHELVSVDEAIKRVLERTRLEPKGVEYVDLESALYRVLAVDVYAPIDYPPFDRSEVDGYAVKSDSVSGVTELNPAIVRVVGRLNAGEWRDLGCEEGAVEVSTGAVIPSACDAVVMKEYAEEEGGFVRIYRPVAPGENVSTAGSDISAGDLILPRGIVLRHEHIALLAGLGLPSVPVFIKPKIAVYSTGSEVVRPGEALKPGRVYDVNGFLVTSFLRELGAEAVYRGILPDDYNSLREAISVDLENYDAVFTSGGTSAGEHDLVYRVFRELGELVVHGLKAKPGRPTAIAVSKGKLLVGLPGFPLSTYMILVRVVKPLISKLTGLRYYEERLYARLPIKVRKGLGKTWLLPSIIVESGDGYTAYPVTFSSGSIYAIAFSDGFVELDENVDYLEEGSLVPFYAFSERARSSSKLVVIGSNDPLLENLLVESGLVYASKVLNTGSLGGWVAASRGEVDIAPTHLFDPETGLYNTPFLEKYGLSGKAVIVRGYDRLIGLVVARGNPKGIRGFEDFFRGDVRIVNRPRGSGVRALLDMNLERVARELGLSWREVPLVVKGYTYEVKTHTAVAIAVKMGKADVGLAVGYVADIYGLDFIPLTWEEYDFLVPSNKLEKPLVRAFIEALRGLESLDNFAFEKHYRVPRDVGSFKAH